VHRGEQERAVEAFQHLQEAVLSAPTPTALYHYELGHAAWHAGRSRDAIMIATAIERLWPPSPTRWFAVGRTLLGADRPRAVEALAEAARNPPAAFNTAAFIVDRLGVLGAPQHSALAVELGRKIVAGKPKSAAARTALGMALLAKKDFDLAIIELQEATRLDPSSALAHLKLAESYMRTSANRSHSHSARPEDRRRAIVHCRESVRLNPRSHAAWTLLGAAMSLEGETDESIRCFEKALEIEPDDAGSLCNLGRALHRRGDLEGALAKLEAGHRLGSEDPRWSYPSETWIRRVRDAMELRALEIPAESRPASQPVSR